MNLSFVCFGCPFGGVSGAKGSAQILGKKWFDTDPMLGAPAPGAWTKLPFKEQSPSLAQKVQKWVDRDKKSEEEFEMQVCACAGHNSSSSISNPRRLMCDHA